LFSLCVSVTVAPLSLFHFLSVSQFQLSICLCFSCLFVCLLVFVSLSLCFLVFVFLSLKIFHSIYLLILGFISICPNVSFLNLSLRLFLFDSLILYFPVCLSICLSVCPPVSVSHSCLRQSKVVIKQLWPQFVCPSASLPVCFSLLISMSPYLHAKMSLCHQLPKGNVGLFWQVDFLEGDVLSTNHLT